MNSELSILPKQATTISSGALSIDIIQVVDDRTNIGASENLKVVKKMRDEFESACEPVRLELYEPYKMFTNARKEVLDKIDGWINTQKKTIGTYNIELMKIENEKLRIEAESRQEEKPDLTKSIVKSDFVKSTISEKPEAKIINLFQFICHLIETNNVMALQSIFGKYNESKLNEFCKLSGINGREIKCPGLSVEMIPDIKIR